MITIGILDLQGDVEEHQIITEKALKEMKIDGTTKLVNTLDDIKDCNYLKETGIPILGTCAGLVLLSKKTDQDQPLLGLIDSIVKRNGFGRQRMSFESEIKFNNEDYHGIFIRAPYISQISDDVEVLSKYDDKIIAVKQNQYIGIAFHPELTEDTLIHKLFILEVESCVV